MDNQLSLFDGKGNVVGVCQCCGQALPVCLHCGTRLQNNPNERRPRKFCSDACRVNAYHHRKREQGVLKRERIGKLLRNLVKPEYVPSVELVEFGD